MPLPQLGYADGALPPSLPFRSCPKQITDPLHKERCVALTDTIDQLNRFRYWLLGCAGVLSVILHYVLPGGRR